VRGYWCASVLALGMMCLLTPARPMSAAESYPNRPIRLLHGFAAGGAADALARIVSDALTKRLGQPFVIEAKPDAGGNIGAAMVANADPNGYTIGLVTGGHAISGALYKSLAFSPTDSFEMVSTLVYYSFVIAVRSDSPVKRLPELIAFAKSKSSEVSFGSAGFGTTQHLAGELLNTTAGIKMLHVPYRGDSAAHLLAWRRSTGNFRYNGPSRQSDRGWDRSRIGSNVAFTNGAASECTFRGRGWIKGL